MKLHPQGRRYVIQRESVKVSQGGIIIPEEAQKGSLVGTVIVKGPDCELADLGDKILFGRYSGFELPLNSDKFSNCLMMNEEDILCKITEYEEGDVL